MNNILISSDTIANTTQLNLFDSFMNCSIIALQEKPYIIREFIFIFIGKHVFIVLKRFIASSLTFPASPAGDSNSKQDVV